MDASKMIKFNLNDEVFVQITDYGKNYLIDKSGQAFWDVVIESRMVTIGEEQWCKIQAHCIADYFSGAIWATNPAPIKPNILVTTTELQTIL